MANLRFVLSGRASTVFDLIALKAKRQAELEVALKSHACLVSASAMCGKPDSGCRGCPLWADHIEGRE